MTESVIVAFLSVLVDFGFSVENRRKFRPGSPLVRFSGGALRNYPPFRRCSCDGLVVERVRVLTQQFGEYLAG